MPTSTTPIALQSRSGYPFPAGTVAQERARAWPTVGACAEERDFEGRRRLLARSGRRGALERVAALLVVISRNNSYEGRDPSAIPDSLTSGFVADLLGLSVASLADVLVELKDGGLVVPTSSSGLRVVDRAGLERLAEAA